MGAKLTPGVKYFCTIYGVADVRVPSEAFLGRVLEQYNAFGINNLYNTTDSAFEMSALVNRLKAVGFRTDSLEIYGRAQGMANQPRLLDEWLSFVNHRLLINCGMDSGDDAMLHQGIVKSSSVKGSRLSENRQAVLNVKAIGAHLLCSLIFGSPGETRESCERTLEFIEWSRSELGPQLDVVETDIYWLNFGSPASRVFHDLGYAQQLAALAGKALTQDQWQHDFARHSNELNVPWSAQLAWYRHFTDMDVELAYEFNARAKKIMSRHPGAIQARDYAFKPPQAEA